MASLAGHSGDTQVSLEDFFENGAVGLHIVARDGTILRANKAELALLGYAPEEYIGRHIADFHADPETISDILQRLSRGEILDKYPARLKTKMGHIRRVLISSSVCFDESGLFVNTRCFTVDVTDKLQTEDELREAEQRLSATYDHARVGISEVDEAGGLLRTNEAFVRLTGYPKDELIGRTVFSITHPGDVAVDQQEHARQVRGEIDRYAMEKRFIRADGSIVWVDLHSSTVTNEAGSFRYSVRVVHDITHRKRSEDRLRLMINELNHRVKNTLSTVQSYAKQTARGVGDVDDFMQRFEGRLLALSRAHDRLTDRNWEGASLAEIVREGLGVHSRAPRGISFDGPDIALPPRAALALSMALHELGTNAAKYGALTHPDGRIHVAWTMERDDHAQPGLVRFRWSESGGPKVVAPERKGFGSRLLEAMAEEVGGKTKLEYAEAGLQWEVAFSPSFAASTADCTFAT